MSFRKKKKSATFIFKFSETKRDFIRTKDLIQTE